MNFFNRKFDKGDDSNKLMRERSGSYRSKNF